MLTPRWWGCTIMRPLWRAVWQLLRRLTMESPHNPAVPVWGKWQHASTRKALRMNGHGSITRDSQKVETSKCPPIDEGINKIRSSHMLEYCPAIKSDEVLIHTIRMNPGNFMVGERRQTQMHAFLRNSQSRTIHRDRNRLMVA